MPSPQDGSNFACNSQVSAAVVDLGSEEIDRTGVLTYLAYGPSVLVNPWAGNGSAFSEVFADEEL